MSSLFFFTPNHHHNNHSVVHDHVNSMGKTVGVISEQEQGQSIKNAEQ